jgi:hypothetical protein
MLDSVHRQVLDFLRSAHLPVAIVTIYTDLASAINARRSVLCTFYRTEDHRKACSLLNEIGQRSHLAPVSTSPVEGIREGFSPNAKCTTSLLTPIEKPKFDDLLLPTRREKLLPHTAAVADGKNADSGFVEIFTSP